MLLPGSLGKVEVEMIGGERESLSPAALELLQISLRSLQAKLE